MHLKIPGVIFTLYALKDHRSDVHIICNLKIPGMIFTLYALKDPRSDVHISSNGGALWGHFFKPEKNLEFFRLKNDPRDAAPGRLE